MSNSLIATNIACVDIPAADLQPYWQQAMDNVTAGISRLQSGWTEDEMFEDFFGLYDVVLILLLDPKNLKSFRAIIAKGAETYDRFEKDRSLTGLTMGIYPTDSQQRAIEWGAKYGDLTRLSVAVRSETEVLGALSMIKGFAEAATQRRA